MASEVTARPPAWMDGVTVAGADIRAQVLGAVVPTAGTVRGEEITALPTPGMAVRVPARLDILADGQYGAYPLELTADTDLDVDASSATLPRIDSVIAEVVDAGDATSIYRYRVLTGTPAATPTPPALPPADQPTARTRRLADVLVRAGAETAGAIRPQDVTYYPSPVRVAPEWSVQVAEPDATAGPDDWWNRFSADDWPPVEIVVPDGGFIKTTISAETRNVVTNQSTMRVSADIIEVESGLGHFSDFGRDAGSHDYAAGSRSWVLKFIPGTLIRAHPTWRVSTVPGAGDYTLLHGELLLEPLA